jgi:hypothetical protein
LLQENNATFHLSSEKNHLGIDIIMKFITVAILRLRKNVIALA